MKIVVLDGYTENPGDLSWSELEKLGSVTAYDRTAYSESPLIAERIGDAEIVVMNKTPISRETIDKCPNIKLIAVLATGYNVVDYNYAREKGIPVVNVPTYGTASVSQFSIALLLEICHHIGHHSESVHAGNWANNADWCYWDYPLIELEGKTIGIIGFGRIGQAEGRIAKALGMNVLAYDLFPNDSGREIAEYVGLDELYACADVITLHCNLTPENTGMINKESIAKMKDGVNIINCSRGELVDNESIIQACESGKVNRYVTDFPATELLNRKNIICTPHLGASTAEAEDNCAIMAAKQIVNFVEKGNIVNSVNYPAVHLDAKGAQRVVVLFKGDESTGEEAQKILAPFKVVGFVVKTKKAFGAALFNLNVKADESALQKLKGINGVTRVLAL